MTPADKTSRRARAHTPPIVAMILAMLAGLPVAAQADAT